MFPVIKNYLSWFNHAEHSLLNLNMLHTITVEMKLYLMYLVITFEYVQNIDEYKTSKKDKEILLRIQHTVSNPPVEAWSYRYKYSSPQELFLREDLIPKAIVNNGHYSRLSIKKQLLQAVKGENIRLYIFGESVSVGADLGPDNVQNIFHYAIANWWNATIATVTGSHMIRRNIAIGGVLTKYFAKCWHEYLSKDERYDMAIWEFNINDAKDPDLRGYLELFTRSIYRRFKTLDLMFAIFYRSNGYIKDVSRRHDVSEEMVKYNSKYFKLTAVNIETFINDTEFMEKAKNFFVSMHPSVLAHAQMALVFVRYYTKTILQTIGDWLRHGIPKHLDNPYKLPPPKFIPEDTKFQTICWTGVLPNVKQIYAVHHPIFSLNVNHSEDFIVSNSPMKVIEERLDNLSGYYLNKTGAHFYISFNVPGNLSLPCNVSIGNRQVVKDSQVKVRLLKGETIHAEQYILSNDRDPALYVDVVGLVFEGLWTLNFHNLKGDFLLTAILIC